MISQKVFDAGGSDPFKWILQRAMYPVACVLAKMRIPATLVTLVGFIFAALAAAALVVTNNTIAFTVCWSCYALADVIDGMVARLLGTQNKTALRLDATVDLLAFVIAGASVGIYWGRNDVWLAVLVGVSGLLVFSLLNVDWKYTELTTESTTKEAKYRSHKGLTFRVLATFNMGSVMLLPASAYSAQLAIGIFGYYALVTSANGTRLAIKLRAAPKVKLPSTKDQ